VKALALGAITFKFKIKSKMSFRKQGFAQQKRLAMIRVCEEMRQKNIEKLLT
jgi:hypothetical protein